MSSPAMNHPLLQLFIARFREFIRTPEAVFWSYVFPLVMMLSLETGSIVNAVLSVGGVGLMLGSTP